MSTKILTLFGKIPRKSPEEISKSREKFKNPEEIPKNPEKKTQIPQIFVIISEPVCPSFTRKVPGLKIYTHDVTPSPQLAGASPYILVQLLAWVTQN